MKKCLKVAGQASAVFYKKYYYIHMESEEVQAEAYLAMADALITYQPDRGRKIESWVGFKVNRHLKKRFLKDYRFKEVHIKDFDELISNGYDMERTLLVQEAIENSDPLSKEIMKLLLKGKLITKNDNKNTIKQEIMKTFRERGYGIQKIKKAFNELKKIATMSY